MNSVQEVKFFSAPGKIRLKPLSKGNNYIIGCNTIVNNYIIL